MGNERELLEAFAELILGRGDADRVCTPDVEYRDGSANTHGIAELRQYLSAWSTAFPDATIDVENVLESGDRAAAELRYRGTQTGPFAGAQGEVPATGRSVDINGSGWITIRDGKIARFDGYFDTMPMMVQLGLMPQPATA